MSRTAARLVAIVATTLAVGFTVSGPARSAPVDPGVPSIVYTQPCHLPWTNVILGTTGNDTLIGTAGDDLIIGFGGDDYIEGRGGRDSIYGGAGDDVMIGGAGDDCINGGDDTDTTWTFSSLPDGTDTDQSVEARYEY